MANLLLIVDMQEGFRYRGNVKLTPKINRLIEKFRGDKAFCCFADKKGSKFERDLKWSKFQKASSQKLLKEVNRSGLRTFRHSGYSILTKELLSFISRSKPSGIYLCGIYSNVSISKAALDLFDRGIDVKVVADATASDNGKAGHTHALTTLVHALGRKNVVKTSEVV